MPRLNETASLKSSPGRAAFYRTAERANRRRAWPRWVAPMLRVTLVVALLAGMGGGGFWLWRNGIAQNFSAGIGGTVIQATAAAGFRVEDVMVIGRSGAEKAELLAALGIQRGDPILGFSLAQAQGELERLPWVAAATVERRLPDRVLVRITERQPMALWQFDRKVVLIDRFGKILADQGVERYNKLPIIVGKGAPEHAPELLGQLAGQPILLPHVSYAVWVGGRRWDLRLDNGINVRLPEYDYGAALGRLSDLVSRESLFDRDIVAIDLRLPDRLIVQTNESGAPHHRGSGEKI